MKGQVGTVLALVFGLAIVYLLVRPDSQAAELVKALGNLGTSLISTVTNYQRGK